METLDKFVFIQNGHRWCEYLVYLSRIAYSGWLQLDVLMHAKDVKVHVADIGTIVLLTNPTSFIGII